MKQILLLSLAAFSLCSCEKYHTRNTEINEFIRSEYYDDARQIYYDEFSNNKLHKNYNEARFDEKEIDHNLKLIQLVYDSELPERDTVFSEYSIKKYCSHEFKHLTIKLDTHVILPSRISKMNFDGLPRLQSFVEKYNVESIELLWASFPNFYWVSFNLEEALNPIKLIDDLYEIEGIEFASGSGICIGDGDNISVRRKPGHVEIDFSIGWGDCPSGCLRRKGWIFKIKNNQVTLKKRYEN
ncbi:MAG: hypothetical protein ACPGLV_13100 [Bacteroidia bacterium]